MYSASKDFAATKPSFKQKETLLNCITYFCKKINFVSTEYKGCEILFEKAEWESE